MATPVTNPPPPRARSRIWSVRLLRAQQALVQSQKSAQETLGTASGFRDIRAELINNRVDTEDRKQRLQQQLAEPLERIGRELFPEFDVRLQRLAERLDSNLEDLATKRPTKIRRPWRQSMRLWNRPIKSSSP